MIGAILVFLVACWLIVAWFGWRVKLYRVTTPRFSLPNRSCQYCDSTERVVEVTMGMPNFYDGRTGHLIPRPRHKPNGHATYVDVDTQLCYECFLHQEFLLKGACHG